MRNFSIIICLLVFCRFAFAAIPDSITITGKIAPDCRINEVRLNAYIAGVPDIDTLPVSSSGVFEIKLPNQGPWQYFMAAPGFHYQFLITPAQRVNQFTVVCNDNGTTTVNLDSSTETDAFKQTVAVYKNLINESVAIVSGNIGQDSCWVSLHSLFVANNAAIAKIKERYPRTFAAEVMCDLLTIPEQMPGEDYVKTLELAILDKKIWNDTSFYHVEMAIDFNGFLGILEARVSDDEKSELMRLKLAHQPTDPGARRLYQVNLFQYLFYQGKEKLLRVFCDWAHKNPQDVKSDFLRMQLERLSKVVYGKKFVDVVYKDPDGNVRKLSEVVGKQPYTMLVLWSPECSHCRQTMPDIIKLYNNYHAKGLEIFAIAGDCEENDWKEYCKNMLPAWINVREPKAVMPSAFGDYMVANMPAFVLIDKNGIIQSRYGSLQDIEKILNGNQK
jgi:thiol-disulfide isomerase/thioredoxin